MRSRKLGWRRIWILPRVFAAVGEFYPNNTRGGGVFLMILVVPFLSMVFITIKSPIWATLLEMFLSWMLYSSWLSISQLAVHFGFVPLPSTSGK